MQTKNEDLSISQALHSLQETLQQTRQQITKITNPPKIILEFNTEDYIQRDDAERAIYASRFVEAVKEFDQQLRNIHKYSDESDQVMRVERVRELLHENLKDAGVWHVFF